jgi:predicted MFS family arabinose efflux permease
VITDAAAPARSDLRAWPVALLLGSASFLVLFDSLAVATALPAIGTALSAGPAALQWVVSLYSVSIGAFLILGGRVGDLYGHRRVLLGSLAVSTVAGLVAGVAPGLDVLLVGRVLQGVAAAFALPAALAIAATVFPEEPWRGRVFSVVASAAWAAGLAGAMLGGLITVHFGWRWIFLVTVPIGAAAVAAGAALLPRDPRRDGDRERLDITGALLASTGLVTLLIGLVQLGEGAHTGRAIVTVAGAAALFAALVFVERRAEHPLVRPSLLRSRRMVGASLGFGAYCAGYTALVVVGSLRLQEEHGLSPASTGVLLSPVLVAGIVSAALTARVLRRYTSRTVVATAVVLCAFALTMIATAGGDVIALLPWLVLWGICSGPVYVRLNQECVTNAAAGDRGTASALLESMSHIGGGIAAAAYLTMLGGGVGFQPVMLAGAIVVAGGAAVIVALMPRA